MTEDIKIPVTRLPNLEGLDLPAYATQGSAGVDLFAAIDAELVLEPFSRMLIPTGIAIALPEGYEAQVRARSGLALNYGVTVLNQPGTIDPDYRGQIQVILCNLSKEPFKITRGMRIAQLVIARYAVIKWAITQALPVTTRGSNGFGSTGEAF